MDDITRLGERARAAADQLALRPAGERGAALLRAADAIDAASTRIIAANREDRGHAQDGGISATLLDRLTLTPERIAAMATGLRAVAALPDPLGEVIDGWRRPNGLEIRQVRVPLGVVAVIYEARPNVSADVAGLCVRSGNAAILRGSAAALHSNQAVVGVIADAFDTAGMPGDTVQLVTDVSRETAVALMRLRGLVDLLVPRGGPALVAQLVESATVPYVIDGDGNCHLFVDAAADLDKAVAIAVNAKASRPAVCNALETLLVHEAIAAEFLPMVGRELATAGVELRADERAAAMLPTAVAATEADWATEYLDRILAVRVVADVEAAIAHVRRYSSGHTEAIVTEDLSVARRFVAACPAAVVMVNASTRFTDGEEFGFGAEIGNSTQRLHARGPMGLRQLTTYRYEVWGDGQVRE